MAMTVFNAIVLSLMMLQGAEAAAINMRGKTALPVNQLQLDARDRVGFSAPATTDWTSLGLGFGIGAIVAGAVAFAVMNKSASDDPKEDIEQKDNLEGDEVEVLVPAAEATPEEADSSATDYQELVKILAQKVAQEVGPKLSKSGAVASVLNNRMNSFTDKAKSFLLAEMSSTAGAVLKELDAPEAMMLLDMETAVEANFPPASILMAGVLSPTIINLMSLHHFVQMLAVGFPIMILCICAIYIDWSAPCSIPTIFAWLFTQTALAFLLILGHGALLFKVFLGRRTLAAKAQEVHEKNKESEGNVRDEFVGNTIILQEALLVENGIRTSVWNTVVGAATCAWVITTIWNLVLIIGWTFVPGVVAFHPKAAEVAKGEYCGAWMTVLVLRINMLLAVLFLFFNLATVVKWVCDMMIDSQAFQASVLKQARDMDKNASGLPVMELIMKAFLLRGTSDTLDSKLSVVQQQKAKIEKETAEVTAKLAALNTEIDYAKASEQALKANAEAVGGDLAAQVSKLTEGAEEHENFKAQGSKALEQAEARAIAVQEATQKALDDLWEKIQKMMEAAQNSETAKAMAAKYQELEGQFQESMATLQDPEFQQKLLDAAQQASAQAKDLADSAIAAAKDPEMQKKLNQMAQDAMENAQKAAEEVAAAANDPEKRKQLQEAAQKAMEQAQATAADAAAAIQDPEMQKKMKEAAQNAMDQAQFAAESAIAAAQDPAMQKKLKEAAQKAMDDAKAAAKKAADAVNDPELQKQLQEAAEKAMQDAQAAAEQAKAAAQDPEMQKKLAAAAQKYKEQAQSAAATVQDADWEVVPEK